MQRLLAVAIAILYIPALVVVAASAPPGTLRGKVISVADGDTLTILVGKESVRIRLEGIDAPEAKQAFGNKAKQYLQSLVHSKEARVETTGQDKYGRTLGEVFIGDVSLNHKMVEEGFAWHYKQFSNAPELARAEAEAKKKKAGLWADANPLPPWEFRKRQKLPPEFSEAATLAEKTTSTGTKPSGPTEVKSKNTTTDAGYWLNISSGVRHNASCQHYKNTKRGRVCTKSEGKPCGICGG